MLLFNRFILLLLTFFLAAQGYSQQLITKRSTYYALIGTSGGRLNQFDKMLESRGLSGLRNKYQTIGLGYQARINDFVLGVDVLHNRGGVSKFDDFSINYRTSRALVNVGYAFTEESRFQLIHYMSLGVGFLNFQMLPSERPANLNDFLTKPEQGFILRKKDIQKGTFHYGNFLTEIGFQLSYDFDLPGRPEALQVISKFGYSFSPLAGKWNMNEINFDNTQSGAFIRVGAGISLPDRNFFYKDASIGISIIRGVHFSNAKAFNAKLEDEGLNPLDGTPTNWGLRILGNTERILYGAELYNLALNGNATAEKRHSLNSLRIYGNVGYNLIEFRNFGFGFLTGLGYGNIRYTLSTNVKPDFPELFEQRKFDGYLKNSGLMIKPEAFAEYGIPMSKRKLFDLVFTAAAGYEVPLAKYKLGGFSMSRFMAGPYLSFGVGIRP